MACVRAKIDLIACEGATFDKNFVWKSGDPAESVDITDYTGVCHIRDKIDDEEPDFILEDGVGVVVKNQSTDPGGYKMYMAPDDTEGACIGNKRRSLVYDLRLTAPDGTVRMQQFGKFTIEPAVTRPWELTP